MDDIDDFAVQPIRSARPSAGGEELLASDAERDAAAEVLRSHCAAGRLGVDELEERLAQAWSARTVDQLEHLLRDLPRPDRNPPRASGDTAKKVKPGLPGLRRFRQDHELPLDPERAFREAVRHILPVMVGAGYDVISRVDNELLVFERRDERVVVSFSETGIGRARLVVQGTARRAVRKAFAKLAAG